MPSHRHGFVGRAAVLLSLLVVSLGASAEGFDRSYKLYVGDIDADGRTDIYVNWQPQLTIIAVDDLVVPIPRQPRGVGRFVLQQNASGGFGILSSLTPAQANAVASWPELASSVARIIEDFNADGYMDLRLRNLSSAISGVADQIVYAATSRNAAPFLVRSIDAALVKFATEVYGYVTDAQYFANHAARVTVPSGTYTTYIGYIFEPYPQYWAAACVFYTQCQYRFGNINDPFADPNDTDGIQNVWHWWGVQIVTGNTWLDYSVFHPRAMGFAAVIKPVIEGTQDITAGSSIEQRIKSDLLAVLGTAVYGGVFLQQPQSVDYVDEEQIRTDRLRALLQLLASLATPSLPEPFTNPLPGAWINKANSTGTYNCTADGRFGTHRPGGHGGVDLGASSTVAVNVGTNVVAAADGTAVPGVGAGHGTIVELYYPGYIFRYSHLSGTIARGRVNGGVVVGQVGKTGNASAPCIKPHLHFEVGDTTLGLVDPASVSSVFTWALEP